MGQHVAQCAIVRTFGIAPLALCLAACLGCVSEDRVAAIDKKIEAVEMRVKQLENPPAPDLTLSPFWQYRWFNLGQEYHQVVDARFFVSIKRTVFRQNGYEIEGVIANLDTLAKSDVKIQCAIKDSSGPDKLTIGFISMPYLPPGDKRSFTVFVPTSEAKVSEVGVSIESYRM
jgi:hypothetical protein